MSSRTESVFADDSSVERKDETSEDPSVDRTVSSISPIIFQLSEENRSDIGIY